jgi:hypothetical protein
MDEAERIASGYIVLDGLPLLQPPVTRRRLEIVWRDSGVCENPAKAACYRS